MFDWIKDGINPRGYEYGATARAARAAKRNAEATEDLLELEMAAGRDERAAIARRIHARRRRESSRRAFWRNVDAILSLAFIVAVLWIVFAPSSNAPESAVTRDTPAHVSQDPDDTCAPATSVRAPDSRGYDADRCNGDGKHPS